MSRGSPPQPLFEQTRTRAIILGSFFVLFLPLVLLQSVPNQLEWLPYLFLFQVVGLGVTHFFITLAVYFQSRNLQYFNSSVLNRLIYFVAPAAILVFFAFSAAAQLRRRAPVFSKYLFAVLPVFDFFHVGRQSFGMLQLFKRPFGDALPASLRRGENAFFIGMALLQWETLLLGGRFASQAVYAQLPAAAMFALWTLIALGYLQAAYKTGARPWIALSYFLMQAVCAAAAVYRTHLYVVALALHYVEYHVIMAPRCLSPPLDPRSKLDRAYGQLSSRPMLFYAVLVLVVILFEGRNHIGSLPPTTTFFVHIFDGIFFVHYFIDGFLWKFRNPFYRETLAPLYFAPGPRKPKRRRRAWLPLGVGALLVLGYAAGWFDGPVRGLQAHVIDPVHADNHVRWGKEQAGLGDLEAARQHFLEATERDPGDAQAKTFLRMTEERMSNRAR